MAVVAALGASTARGDAPDIDLYYRVICRRVVVGPLGRDQDGAPMPAAPLASRHEFVAGDPRNPLYRDAWLGYGR